MMRPLILLCTGSLCSALTAADDGGSLSASVDDTVSLLASVAVADHVKADPVGVDVNGRTRFVAERWPIQPRKREGEMLTDEGCACQREWKMVGREASDCEDSCCNPDKDKGGEWCFTQSDCERNWGYCRFQRSLYLQKAFVASPVVPELPTDPSFGVTLREEFDGGWTVVSIKTSGHMALWNRKHPSQAVNVGDVIISANNQLIEDGKTLLDYVYYVKDPVDGRTGTLELAFLRRDRKKYKIIMGQLSNTTADKRQVAPDH